MKRPLMRKIGYLTFALLSLLSCLYWTMPMDAVGHRLVSEIGQRSGGTVNISYGSIATYWLSGVEMQQLSLRYEPAGGEKIDVKFESVAARLAFLPLLTGSLEVSFDARLNEGSLSGTVGQDGVRTQAAVRLENVDFSKPPLLAGLIGMPAYGSLSGNVEIDWPAAVGERTGTASMTLRDAAAGPGEIALAMPGMSGLKIPAALQLGQLDFTLDLRQGQAKVSTFKQSAGEKKPDILLRRVDAGLSLKKSIRSSRYDACIEVKLDQSTAQKHPTLGGLMDLAGALVRKDSTGYLHLPLSGTFSGKPRTSKRLCKGTSAK